MIEKCYDEGTLQAFLDNELAPELSQAVARHLVDCDPCAMLLAEVEEETAFVFSALEEEFNTLVPTQRLWTKINQSIEVECRQRSLWQNTLAFFSGLSFTSPQIAAFGSLLLIVGVVAVLLGIKPANQTNVAGNTQSKPTVSTTKSVDALTPSIAQVRPAEPDAQLPEKEEEAVEPKRNTAPSQYRIENARYAENNHKPAEKSLASNRKDIVKTEVSNALYLPGEETYVSTIARLEQTVNNNKDEVLKPSARFSYEKNMAVVNDAIKRMKQEVRKNPKNEAAKQVLLASYQNKIDLLNSLNERGELMASMR